MLRTKADSNALRRHLDVYKVFSAQHNFEHWALFVRDHCSCTVFNESFLLYFTVSIAESNASGQSDLSGASVGRGKNVLRIIFFRWCRKVRCCFGFLDSAVTVDVMWGPERSRHSLILTIATTVPLMVTASSSTYSPVGRTQLLMVPSCLIMFCLISNSKLSVFSFLMEQVGWGSNITDALVQWLTVGGSQVWWRFCIKCDAGPLIICIEMISVSA